MTSVEIKPFSCRNSLVLTCSLDCKTAKLGKKILSEKFPETSPETSYILCIVHSFPPPVKVCFL